MKSLVIVNNSPLQILNAIEALSLKGQNLSDTFFICFAIPNTVAYEQIKKTAVFYGIEINFITFKKNFISKATRFGKMKKILKGHSFGYVFISMLDVDLNIYACNLFPLAEVCFHDEGTIILEYKKRWTDTVSIPVKKGFGGFMKKLLFSLKEVQIDEIITVFDKDLMFLSNKVKISLNNYAYIKKKLSDFKREPKIYCIGQDFYNKELPSAEVYFTEIKKIIKVYGAENIVYIPHRYETKEYLLPISEMGLEIITPDLCIELYFAAQGVLPHKIVGFTSTALINLQRIYGDILEIESFVVDFKNITDSVKLNRIKTIYKALEDNQIKMIKEQI